MALLELRAKLLILTFEPTLGEGKSGLRLCLSQASKGERRVKRFLGEEEGDLRVAARSVGSSSAVWGL